VKQHHETYKGHEILVTQPAVGSARSALGPTASEEHQPELFVNNEPVFTVQDGAGLFVASGLAYDPQPSLLELGRRIVDSREATRRDR
jgi:hypothetical protein